MVDKTTEELSAAVGDRIVTLYDVARALVKHVADERIRTKVLAELKAKSLKA